MKISILFSILYFLNILLTALATLNRTAWSVRDFCFIKNKHMYLYYINAMPMHANYVKGIDAASLIEIATSSVLVMLE